MIKTEAVSVAKALLKLWQGKAPDEVVQVLSGTMTELLSSLLRDMEQMSADLLILRQVEDSWRREVDKSVAVSRALGSDGVLKTTAEMIKNLENLSRLHQDLCAKMEALAPDQMTEEAWGP